MENSSPGAATATPAADLDAEIDAAVDKKGTFRERRLSIQQNQDKNNRRRLSIYGSEDPLPDAPQATVPAGISATCSCKSMPGLEPVPGGSHAKINQDRAIAMFPFPTEDTKAIGFFGVYDGHGKQGERVSQYVITHLPDALREYPELLTNTGKAFTDAYLKVCASH